MPAATVSRTTRWAFALGLLAVVLRAAPAAAGVDDPAPAFEGPWIIEVGPEVAVIVDGQGSVAMMGEAQQRLAACEATAGCSAFWEGGLGAVVIVDQSAAPASPPSPGAASAGATPR